LLRFLAFLAAALGKRGSRSTRSSGFAHAETRFANVVPVNRCSEISSVAGASADEMVDEMFIAALRFAADQQNVLRGLLVQ
jgi:hypothetical protein